MKTIISKHLLKIAENFPIPGQITSIAKLTSGNIHDTFLISTSCSQEKGFILQKINRNVFVSPEKIAENIQVLSEHMKRERNKTDAIDLSWRIPDVIKTHTQDVFVADEDGTFWRVSRYIENSTTYTRSSDPEIIYRVGCSLGQFHCLTSTLDISSLHDILNEFHITPHYYDAFYSNLKNLSIDTNEDKIRYCLSAISAMRSRIDILEKAKLGNELKLRTIHGDPKISNILFHSQTKMPLGIIDLDTVQPGLLHYDIGDCARSCCNQLGEETEEFNRIWFDLALFQKLMEGYLEQVSAFFSENDYRYIYDCIHLITFELGLRFLHDYLTGSPY